MVLGELRLEGFAALAAHDGALSERGRDVWIGGVLTYIDLGSARTRNELAVGTYSGKYDTFRLVVLGVNFDWR